MADKYESKYTGAQIDACLDDVMTLKGERAGERLSVLEKWMADESYVKITASLSVSPYIKEIGESVSDARLTWNVSKETSAITLDGVSVDGKTSYTDPNTYTTNKTWTLNATEKNGKTDGTFEIATATATLSFLNGVYYGVSSNGNINNEDTDAILAFTKTLRSSKLTSFNVTAGDGEYIYYCLPKRMGTCSFKVGGFDGGFTLQSEGSFTNASGYTETYYIYRSDNASLGATSVTVA